ncbi:MAG: tail fiber domain-containing protein [Saprospiraceae bacterium]|nr:tail fiber domain-containing protein [Saprospiraceae bacterium]
MKKNTLILAFMLFSQVPAYTQGVGINADNTDPDASAILDVKSVTKGMLIPRMTSTQRDAIGTPATSLMIYNTSISSFEFYNNTAWIKFGSTGLEQVTEGGNTGWRLFGANSANHGNIGSNAVDLSYSFYASATRGATGNYSTATGFYTIASGHYSFVMGYGSVASGEHSTAMGLVSTASGSNSIATGYLALASGNQSVAMGSNTAASGTNSVALGSNSTALGYISTAMGSRSTASGAYSTAMGSETTAPGYASTAMGDNTTANSAAETVMGMYNTDYTPTSASSWNATDRLFVVGNGVSTFSKSDAFILYKNGNATLSGTLTQSSDRTLKTNILPLSSSLSNILELGGYSYHWINTEKRGEDKQIGVIAQEVEALYPELVHKDGNDKLTVNYSGLIPVLIEATKEQQNIIEQQSKNIEQQNEKIMTLESEIREIKELLKKNKLSSPSDTAKNNSH